MIMPFENLKNLNFSLRDIKVFKLIPSYKTLSVPNRSCNSLLYLEKGSCIYSFKEGEFSLKSGAVIYLPFHSNHKLTVTSEAFSYYRIDFTLKSDGDIVLFSTYPIKITDNASPECIDAITDLANNFYVEENSILATERICRIFLALQKNNKSADIKRLTPAIKHIQEHFTEEINYNKLSELCFLGSSRFYELFHKEFGVTPLEYRNRIIVKQAKTLLLARDISVKEIAFNLGFQNVAYFSRFFKKHTGYSPTEYIKSIEN